jgi:hypothetical protein
MESKNMPFRKYIVNALYLTVVFAAVFLVATQALVRKINTYNLAEKLLFLTVDKQDVNISTTIAGKVEEVRFKPGDHVKEGDIIVRLSDESVAARVEALEDVADDNLSARTELELIKSRASEYDVRATRSGILYEIPVTKGSYVLGGSAIATLFADEDVKLVGSIRPEQYALIEKRRGITVFSARLGQAYIASFEGVGKVKEDAPIIDANGQPQVAQEKYEILFTLRDEEAGASFIEGERLDVIPDDRAGEHLRPVERLTLIWNSLILGVDPNSILERNETEK